MGQRRKGRKGAKEAKAKGQQEATLMTSKRMLPGDVKSLVIEKHCARGLCYGEGGVKVSIQAAAGAIRQVEVKVLRFRKLEDVCGGDV